MDYSAPEYLNSQASYSISTFRIILQCDHMVFLQYIGFYNLYVLSSFIYRHLAISGTDLQLSSLFCNIFSLSVHSTASAAYKHVDNFQTSLFLPSRLLHRVLNSKCFIITSISTSNNHGNITYPCLTPTPLLKLAISSPFILTRALLVS